MMFALLLVTLFLAVARAAPTSSLDERAGSITCNSYHTGFIKYYGPNGTIGPLDYDGDTEVIIYSAPSNNGEVWEFQTCNSSYVMGSEASETEIHQGHIISTSTSRCLTAHRPFKDNVTVTLEPCYYGNDRKQLTQWWAWVETCLGSYILFVAERDNPETGIIGASYGPSFPPSEPPPFYFPLKLYSQTYPDPAFPYTLNFTTTSSPPTGCSS